MKASHSQNRLSAALSEIVQDLRPSRLAPALSAGLIDGAIEVPVIIAFSALIFAGEAAAFTSNGVMLSLLGTMLGTIALALFSSYPGSVYIMHDIPAAILGLAVVGLSANMATSSQESLYYSVLAVLAVTSLLTGLAFYLMGRFRLGSLIRFLPYPVIGGFLAGIGWLLFEGGFGILTGGELSLAELPHLFQPETLVRWLPTLLVALAMLLVLRRRSHFLILPGFLVGSLLVFFLILWLTGTSLAAAGEGGWLLGGGGEGGALKPLTPGALGLVDWGGVFGQMGNILTVVFTSSIAILLAATGIEVTVRRRLDLNRELQTAGAGNLLSGLFSAPPGFHAVALSVLGRKLGVESRLTGLTTALVQAAVLLSGAAFLAFFPRPVLGLVLFYFGLSFLVEWLYDGWYKLSRLDYLLVVAILVVSATLGFLQSVLVGVVLAVILFAVNYSRVEIVTHELTGDSFRSNVDRGLAAQRLLQDHGGQLHALKLRGYIFFGTANSLLGRVQERLRREDRPPLRYLVLDFHQVSQVDSSALNSFTLMTFLAESEDFTMVFTDAHPAQKRKFEAEGFHENPRCKFFPDLDHGVEWCEQQILASLAPDEEKPRPSLKELLKDEFPARMDWPAFTRHLERQEVEADVCLIRQGSPPEALYFIESGQVTVHLEGGGDGAMRLRTMGAGTVVGEMQVYLGSEAKASVTTDRPSVVYRLSQEALGRLEQQEPEIATAFHKFIARLLGERLATNNAVISELMR